MRVFDVDDDYQGTFAPERDAIVVNGHRLDPYASGADNQWSINTFLVPTDYLVLPAPGGPATTNDFQVLIDTANGGSDVWAVEVAWAELRLSSGELPVGMVHGINGGADDFDDMEQFYTDNYPALAGRIQRPSMTRRGTVEDNVEILEEEIQDLEDASGSYAVNLLAHSMGGLASRLFAFDHPGEVKSVVMLGTPNGGSRLADIACGIDNAGGGILGLLRPELGIARRVLRSQFGPCDEDTGLFQLQQHYVQRIFNQQVPDDRGTSYSTIAGRGNAAFSALLDGEDDGFVPVASVEYLSREHDSHPGLHDALAVFDSTHSGLLKTSDPGAPLSLCVLYVATCPDLFGVGAERAAATQQALVEPAVDGLESTLVTGADIPAQSSLDLELSFEGSSAASISVLSDGPSGSIAASFGGAPLVPSTALGAPALTAELTNPANGSLHITNSGLQPGSVAVLVAVQTERRLTVEGTPALQSPGQPVHVKVNLSSVDPGDSPTASIVNGSGAEVGQVSLAPDGAGSWSGSFIPPSAGLYSIVAAVDGPRPRLATTLFSVSSGTVQLGSTFTESTPDLNGNGFADALVIRTPVLASVPGRYRLAARLVDASGVHVGSAGTITDLTSGASAIDLSFDGSSIFRAGRSGTYRVVDVTLSRADTMAVEVQVPLLGSTAYYDYRSFEHLPVDIALDRFSDRGIDVDSDGSFDRLDVTGEVMVDLRATYAINARLVTAGGAEVGEFATTVSLAAGQNAFTLSFPWLAIRAAGIDGPYVVEDLSIYPLSDSDELGYLVTAHRTAAYDADGLADSITFAALRAMLAHEAESGGVARGISNSLDAKLDAGEAALARGQGDVARHNIEAFRSELWAQRGKQVTEAAYLRLDGSAARLLTRL